MCHYLVKRVYRQLTPCQPHAVSFQDRLMDSVLVCDDDIRTVQGLLPLLQSPPPPPPQEVDYNRNNSLFSIIFDIDVVYVPPLIH